jgi:hypothetical protein
MIRGVLLLELDVDLVGVRGLSGLWKEVDTLMSREGGVLGLKYSACWAK